MAALPFATLSVHHFISQVGDYVGFAAIVAVAIMVLLLFAHARETAELRRRAEYAEDELSLLHEQVEWLREAQPSDVGGTPVPAPAPAAAVRSVPTAAPAGATRVAGMSTGAVTSVGTVGAIAAVPAPASASRRRAVVFGAPVGVGAPALSSATKLIPPTDEELRAVAAAAAESGRAGPATGAAESTGAGHAGAVASAVAAPPPTTVAAGGNGRAPRRPAVAADPRATGGGARAAYPAAVTSPRRNYGAGPERSGRRRVSRVLIAVVTLLVAAIAVAVVLVLVGHSSSGSNHPAGSKHPSATVKGKHKGKHATKTKGSGATVRVNPQAVTVAVLNGTTTVDLAQAVSDKLNAKGFQQGATGNAVNQTMATTTVGYVPGAPGAKNDAYAVAMVLGLKSTAVEPVSTASQSVACSGTPTNCPDQVIVTVGADLNSDAA